VRVLAFGHEKLRIVSDALDVAEDVTGNFYKLSSDQWRRHPYDVKTLASLRRDEIFPHAFAVLSRGRMAMGGVTGKPSQRDCYFICLQDDRILSAVRRDKEIGLFPLLVYVLTHELVHVVRFSSFARRFEASGKTREDEESIVHSTTHDILRRCPIPTLDHVLESYRDHRICRVIGDPWS